MKKILHYAVNLISGLLIFAAIVMLLNVVLTKPGQVPDIGGYSILRVLTGSMEPTIQTDSIILIRKITPEEIKVGDVISYYSSDPTLKGAINTHRVEKITNENGTLYFTTKGDANLARDQYPPNENDIVGVVVTSSHAIGVIIRLFSNPLVFFPLILLPLVVLLVMNLVSAYRSARDIAEKEEAEAIAEALAQARALRQQLEEEKQNVVSEEETQQE